MTRSEIMLMPKEELRIKAQNLRGPKVVCEDWPCGWPPESCKMVAAPFPIKTESGWGTGQPDWYCRRWPIVLKKIPDPRWPPKWSEEYQDWSVDVEPVPDYPNDTAMAMKLWDQIAEPKEITWEDGYICLSWGEAPEAWIKGKITGPDTLPDLLTRAYVWAKTP